LRYIASRFLAAAAIMQQAQPGLQFIAPAIPTLRAELEQVLKASPMAGKVRVLDGQSHAALAACDATLIASGTATLEAALFKRPMVIAYNMHSLSWRLMQRQQLQPWVGLPNILCGDFVVPELLQDAASPEALAAATLEWLASPDKVAALKQRFTTMHEELRRDTPTLCADAIQKVLEG
jgi:lipid-A-disaccharide synthase